jgi:hypothetical protein
MRDHKTTIPKVQPSVESALISSSASPTASTSNGFFKILKRVPLSVKVLGLGALSYVAYDYYDNREKFDPDERKVLVLPFHRMKLVESKRDDVPLGFPRLLRNEDDIVEVIL